MSLQVPLLDATAIHEAMPVPRCMAAVRAALQSLDSGAAVQPLRTVVHLPDAGGSLYTMPAYLQEPPALAVKMVTIFAGNAAAGLPSHQGVVVVFDPRTGRPLLLLEAEELTALRTAAASAVATAVLARPDAGVLAILGTGVQARSHARAVPTVRPVRELRLWGRTRSRAEALAAELRGDGDGAEIVVCGEAAAAVRSADIVCTTTSAREPVVCGEWLAEGVHVNAIGSSTPTARELDSAAAAACSIFVDDVGAAAAEAGDLLIPHAEGVIGGPDSWTPLGAVLNGRLSGRSSPTERTLFKSVGLAVEDAAAAALMLEWYRRDITTTESA